MRQLIELYQELVSTIMDESLQGKIVRLTMMCYISLLILLILWVWTFTLWMLLLIRVVYLMFVKLIHTFDRN